VIFPEDILCAVTDQSQKEIMKIAALALAMTLKFTLSPLVAALS